MSLGATPGLSLSCVRATLVFSTDWRTLRHSGLVWSEDERSRPRSTGDVPSPPEPCRVRGVAAEVVAVEVAAEVEVVAELAAEAVLDSTPPTGPVGKSPAWMSASMSSELTDACCIPWRLAIASSRCASPSPGWRLSDEAVRLDGGSLGRSDGRPEEPPSSSLLSSIDEKTLASSSPPLVIELVLIRKRFSAEPADESDAAARFLL
mmetsp:Transcript_55047/g.109273  ORF Transcript_55047/g.109273 Transcript_55047/m.109273 type:complete len:206 (+) Transcript_55047:1563-2180(+)